MSEAVLHHGKDVEWGVREILEPVPAPVDEESGEEFKGHQLVVLKELHKWKNET